MSAFISWYLIITLLGWLTFPVVYRLFPALADRGYSLARAAGLLVWAYLFWLFTSLGVTANNPGGILFALLPLAGASLYAVLRPQAGVDNPQIHPRAAPRPNLATEILQWIREQAGLVLAVELLFLLTFVALALLRAGNPTLDNAEKPMELMFINSILRSPTFPPHDGWLSGYAISYYYFGYVMTAMLAQLAGISGSIAHNLMTALIFALAAIGAYGILFALLAPRSSHRQAAADRTNSGAALLAPLFLLLVSNLEGFLEVLHRRGILWTGTQNFWTWLGIKDLNDVPAQPLAWLPDRFWWWWRASRVVSDYDLTGGAREVIDEFPFFSFLHADLHPHVLAIPFILLTVAVALNMFLGGWRGETALPGLRLKLSTPGFFAAAFVLGAIAFLNIWDILVAAALIVLAYGLMRVRLEGWSWNRLTDMAVLGVPLALAALLLYLPFYFGFSSQAGGLLPNVASPTRGAQLWVMFAPLFIPLLSYLTYLAVGERRRARWGLALLLSLGLIMLLVVALVLFAWIVTLREPGLFEGFLGTQGVSDVGSLIRAALARRLAFIGGLLTMLAILVPAVAQLAAMRTEAPAHADVPAAPPRSAQGPTRLANPLDPSGAAEVSAEERATHFTFLLIIVASLLVIGPEFIYLRDQFGYRINTIFKFYFQAWLLWSIPAAFGIVVLLRRLRHFTALAFQSVLILLLTVSLTYPVLSISNKTNNFKPFLGWTLDDFTRIQRGNPDEAAAISWLMSAPDGVVAEAVGGSYSDYGRVAAYTGLPTVLGWPGHESQWRGTGDPQGTRKDDMSLLYTTPDWETTRSILEKYDIRYIFVGERERSAYAVDESKLQGNLSLAFQRGTVSIYEVP